MDNIKFYNMHGIKCWIINLKPFDPKTTPQYGNTRLSAKVNEMKYEFTFVSGEPNKKPITCQVKNQNSEPDLYEIQNTLSQKGWRLKKLFNSKSSNFKRYKVQKYGNGEIEYITLGYNGFYITDEFDCFIIDWEDENIEQIKRELEKDLGMV